VKRAGAAAQDGDDAAGAVDYRSAGVDVAAGQRLVRDIGATVAATQGPEVLGNLGGFAGLYALGTYREPVLVSGTDGVGTKLELARAAGRFDTIGIDLVGMCVNDVLCHGAKPLFFLDYVAVDRLDAVDVAAIVSGVAAGCREAGCALIGGETAEMPGVYRPGRFDLAGFAVGAVEREGIIDGRRLESGMALVGLGSSGFHSNGYSLLRRLFPGVDEPGGTPEVARMRDLLLSPTRIYADVMAAIGAACEPAGIAHVTGGGWWENLPRLLGSAGSGGGAGGTGGTEGAPAGTELALDVDAGAVIAPEVFTLLHTTPVTPEEAYRTFNMGLGMAIAMPERLAGDAIRIAADHGVPAWRIGRVVQRTGTDLLRVTGIPAAWPR
jgi:phosphoribosylformylglycinamidine cyclo-ligase